MMRSYRPAMIRIRSLGMRGRNAAGEMTFQARMSLARSSFRRRSGLHGCSAQEACPGSARPASRPPRQDHKGPVVAHRHHDPGKVAAQ